ncbi:MAG: hypothetical protein KIS66_16500 [Fimbriimonadaceae bacterium]|nr:hypothetical protein [Fimbriimonadaceae bacterium]
MELLLAATWCLVWFPIAVWTLATVHWTVGGELDPVTGTAAILMGPFLGLMTITAEAPWLRLLLFFSIFATVILFPFVKNVLDKRAVVSLDRERLATAYDNAEKYPDNAIARLTIAQALIAHGHVAHSVAIAERVLEGVSRFHYSEEIRTLGVWRRMAKKSPPVTAIVCPKCGRANEPGELWCANCRARTYLSYVGGDPGRAAFARKLVALWVVGMAALVGIPSLATALPPLLAIIAIVALMGLGAAVTIRAFRGEVAREAT